MFHATDTLTLVADIGGTNTRVALARGREGAGKATHEPHAAKGQRRERQIP